MTTAVRDVVPATGEATEVPTSVSRFELTGFVVAAVLIAAGAALRLYQYLSDRSLWVDEAKLSNNILARPLLELAGPLDDHQTAPFGFLVLQKVAVTLFGGSEYALRLVPLIFGIAALFLCWGVARRILIPYAALVALGLFAVSSRLVYYSAEAKQYSGDVAVGLLVIWLAVESGREDLRPRTAALLAVVGAAAIWFSQPVVFILAAIGIWLLLRAARGADRERWALLVGIGSAWIASFIAAYAVARRQLGGLVYMQDWWSAGFLPFPPASSADVLRWGSAFANVFRDPLEFTVPLLALAAFAVGTASLLRQRPGALLLLVGPVILTMLAAGFRLYPFGDELLRSGRVILFLAPGLLMVVAAGVEHVRRRVNVRPTVMALLLIAPYLALRIDPAILLPLYRAVPAAVDYVYLPEQPPFDYAFQDERPVIEGLAELREAGDAIYVYKEAVPTFRYYAPRYGIGPHEFVAGSETRFNATIAAGELDPLVNRGTLWFFYAYSWEQHHLPFLEHLGQAANPVGFIGAERVRAWRFETADPAD